MQRVTRNKADIPGRRVCPHGSETLLIAEALLQMKMPFEAHEGAFYQAAIYLNAAVRGPDGSPGTAHVVKLLVELVAQLQP